MNKDIEKNDLNITLADRMKYYESLYDNIFESNQFYLIRLDGNGFSKRIKKWKLNKPFDCNFHWAMVDTCKELIKLIPNAKLIWTCSDEITILCTVKTKKDAWFGNRINKILSLSTSFTTAYFNKFMQESGINTNELPGFFDARIISVPSFNEAINNILSRYNDGKRNSVSMWADSLYSHKQLLNKNSDEKILMMKEKGLDWNNSEQILNWTKYGTFIYKEIVAYDIITKQVQATKQQAEELIEKYPESYFLRTKVKSVDLTAESANMYSEITALLLF